MSVRGIRGATTCEEDVTGTVLQATGELLTAIKSVNPSLKADDIASILFTVTPDINSVYPARAARNMGWDQVPLMCAQEIPVQGSLKKCIRVLIHWNTDLNQNEIHHVYLRDAVILRPDLVNRS
ncbi:MAG: chorismate mutase [Anaerolineae bacterium]|nr:chorismate mutase [Anaerolineae bacterium]